jgi:hypothetical protein
MRRFMRTRPLSTCIYLSLIVSLSGCILPVPVTRPVVPALSGRVLAPSGEPAAGATVVITEPGGSRGSDFRRTVVAGEDGRFTRKEEVHWYPMWLFYGDSYPAPLEVHAEYQGMRSPPREVSSPRGARPFGIGNIGKENVDLGDVYLLNRAPQEWK